MLEITRLEKSDGPLTKRISLSPDGKLISNGSACVMSSGTAYRLPLKNWQTFGDLIQSLGSSEAIALGSLRTDLPDIVRVITKKRMDELNGHADPDVIARTGSAIHYRKGQPALALLDFDTKGVPADVADRIKAMGGPWEALVTVIPGFKEIGRMVRRSTSAGIRRADTGEALPGSNGCHIFITAQDGSDIERFLRTLHDRCWLHGFGWSTVGAAGQLLDRSIVDRTVFAPERLVFEAAPILAPGLVQDPVGRTPEVTQGPNADTRVICPDLTQVEQFRLRDLRASEAKRLAEPASKAKAVFMAVQVERIVKNTGASPTAARRMVERQCAGVLLPNIQLYFDASEFEGCTVGDVLADPARFVGATLADPLEGLDYGVCKSKIMQRTDGSLWINSFAHGRCVYEIKHDARSIEASLRNAKPDEVAALFVWMLLQADLASDEEQALRDIVCDLADVKPRPLNAKIKAAREEQKTQRDAEEQQRQAAERTDTRPQIPVPLPDNERTPVLQMLDEVMCGVKDPEPPMRDTEGRPVEIRCRQPTLLHELSAGGSNQEETDKTRLPPPELPLLTRHDRFSLAHAIEQHVEFVVGKKMRPVALPPVFVDHFLAWRNSAMPRVEAVVTAPLVLPNGALLAPTGLDRERKLVFRIEPGLMRLMPTKDQCTEKDVADALNFLINVWLCDVATNFVGKCILVTMALTILERVLLPERPAFFVTAGKRGGGKTTALTMVILATTGKKPPAAAWSSSEEERRKAMLAYLMEGIAALTWDNLPLGETVACPTLEKVLTSDSYSDRVLSQSTTITVPAYTVMSFTGNNIAPRGDMASRSLNVRLDVDRPDPENRKFIHVDPIAWTLDHRGKILQALYTILIGNEQLKTNTSKPEKTRFKRWWHLVGSAVENAADFLKKSEQRTSGSSSKPEDDNKQATTIDFNAVFAEVEANDDDAGGVAEVLDILNQRFPTTAFQASDVATVVNGDESSDAARTLLTFFDPTGRKAGSVTPRSIGKRLSTIVGTPVYVGEKLMTLKTIDGAERKTLSYQIRAAEKPRQAV